VVIVDTARTYYEIVTISLSCTVFEILALIKQSCPTSSDCDFNNTKVVGIVNNN